MGGRGEANCHIISFIHAPDGEAWARFLQRKLQTPDYNIQATLHLHCQENIQDIFSKHQTCALLVSPSMLEEDHAVFWSRTVDRYHQGTIFLCLGVSRNEFQQSLKEDVRQKVQKNHMVLEVDGSQAAVKEALATLIELYESMESPPRDDAYRDDKEIYDYPPPPRQQNSILKVVPSVIYEKCERELVLILEREAEEPIFLVSESIQGTPLQIPLQKITGSSYVAKLPEILHGRLKFLVKSGEHILGQAAVHIKSQMELLSTLLDQETSPLVLLGIALGIPEAKSSDTEQLDALLASRLGNVHYPQGLGSTLSPDAHHLSDQENCRWPTLLHLAAEFNLTKVCHELMQNPGMIHAACTENSEGFFPCQLAEKNGHLELQQHLLQYVEDMRLKSAADSGVEFENYPCPSPHTVHNHPYINENLFEETEDSQDTVDYVDMCANRLSPQNAEERTFVDNKPEESISPPPLACKSKVDSGYAKPRSYSEGCVKTPYSIEHLDPIPAENETSEQPPSLKPKQYPVRSLSECVRGMNSPRLASAKEDLSESDSSGKSSPETVVNRHSKPQELNLEEECEEISEEQHLPSNRKPLRSSSVASTPERRAVEYDTLHEEHDVAVLRNKNTKRSKSVQDKISHFFRKIKSRRQQSSSESDLPMSGRNAKKTVVYSRQSACSDPGHLTSTLKKSESQRSSNSTSYSESERDSGAVCEEEGSPVLRPKTSRNSPTIVPGLGNVMQRRMSVRVQKAKTEEIGETPILPPKSKSRDGRETFVSFIKQ